MVKKILSVAILVIFLGISLNAFAQFRTRWEQNNGGGIVSWGEGLSSLYDEYNNNATIPSENDAGWGFHADLENIDYSDIPSVLCDTNIVCKQGGEFTYFRSVVDIPVGVDVEKFEISAGVVVDGLSVSIYNFSHSYGALDGSHIAFLSFDTPDHKTENLKDYVVAGENTIIITHVDDCCYVSRLYDVQIILNDEIVTMCPPPVAHVQNITRELDAAGNVSIDASEVDDGSTSECGIADRSVEPDSFTCNDVGQNTVTLTVTDINGKIDQATAIVSIEDNTLPLALCKNIIKGLDAAGDATIVGADVDNGSSDACGIANLSVSPDSFTCENVGATNTVTLIVTDDNGNTSNCTATVTVEDKVAPDARCKDITIQLDYYGDASITAADVDNGSSDACGIASLSVSPDSFTCANVGANTVTLTVTDNNGNVSTCTATVTVEDNVPPDAKCKDKTIYLDIEGKASITTADIDNNSWDACGIAGLELSSYNFDCDDIGENSVTLTVTDNNGNTSTCEATVTVIDNLPPDISIIEVTGSDEGLKLEDDYGYWDSNAVVFWNTDQIVIPYYVKDNCDEDPAMDFIVEWGGVQWEGEEWEGEVKENVGYLDSNSQTLTIDPYELVGRIRVTIIATDFSGNAASDDTAFTIILFIPEGRTIVKPESFCLNPGRFNTFVWFSDPYDVTLITEARCDGAPLEKLNICYDGQDEEVKGILKFRRYGITVLPVDTYFVLRGIFIYNEKPVYFQGFDEVKWECRQERIREQKNIIKEEKKQQKETGNEDNGNGNGNCNGNGNGTN